MESASASLPSLSLARSRSLMENQDKGNKSIQSLVLSFGSGGSCFHYPSTPSLIAGGRFVNTKATLLSFLPIWVTSRWKLNSEQMVSGARVLKCFRHAHVGLPARPCRLLPTE